MSLARLRLAMLAFLLALAVPSAVLVFHAYGQLKWEAFHRHRELADELARRVDERASRLLAAEEARGFADYRFVASEGTGGVLQRSPLSDFPVRSGIPGLVGFFQVDPDGVLTTPLLPGEPAAARRYGLGEPERAARAGLEARIEAILGANRLVSGRAPRTAARKPGAKDDAGETGDLKASLSSLSADEAITVREESASLRDQDAEPLAGRAMEAAPASAAPPVAMAPKLEAPAPAEPAAQAAFDELKKARGLAPRPEAPQRSRKRVEELNLSTPYEDARARGKDVPAERNEAERQLRKEKAQGAAGNVPGKQARTDASLEQRAVAAAGAGRSAEPERESPTRIRTFESELDPFEVSLLDSGHFVLYRKVWRDGRRYIQGALVEQQPLLSGLVESAFGGTALSRVSDLLVAWQGDVLAEYSGDAYRPVLAGDADLAGALLYRTRLSAPLADLELVFTVTHLPVGPGAKVVAWTAGALALVLVAGTWLMYRTGVRQVALARQQQDFVSAVSHELRTPITSIRMYAEMLREGWASEEKKRGYYTFIVQESERLSRLIANVLQLARMTRNEFAVQLQEMPVAELLDGVRSQTASQVEHAGFELAVECTDDAGRARVRVDPDAFSQCMINLVDNALKFSAGAGRRRVEIGCHRDAEGRVNVTVRDHGPGIARDQMKKIFTLFYRSGNELTRETVGTGIGLALVHQLVRAMGGQVDVANAEPGARFTLRFPARAGAPAPA